MPGVQDKQGVFYRVSCCQSQRSLWFLVLIMSIKRESLYTCSLQTKLPTGMKSGARVNPRTDLRASHVRVGVPRHGKHEELKVKVGAQKCRLTHTL